MIMADQSDSLSKYRQKRDFTKTNEPEGLVAETGGNRFLIQKHAASRLHYDFRLELDGVLKSWAVTRGPSPNADDKRLAVEVEDHPVAYGSFEGTIPEGEYGGGTVMLWDEGTWEPIGDPHQGLEKGDLKFILHGKRLHGSWVLARMKPRPQDRGRNNWLLIKHRDDDAFDQDAEAWLDANATSIVSGRTMDEIAADADKVWHSGHAEDSRMDGGPEPRKGKAPSKPRPPVRSKSYKPLKFMTPELATLADAVPEGPEWVHEVKFDGYRTLAMIDQGEVRLMTRSGLDWTSKYQAIADELKSLDVGQAYIDGEIVAVTPQGTSSFQKLKDELGAERSENLQYYAFDLLVLDGENLTRLPLIDRKARLKALIGGQDLHNRVIYSEHFTEGVDFLPRACSLEMEGIISKRADSIYSGKRGEAWLKVKCHKRQEFVIVGYTESEHAGRGFRSLLLGYFDGDELKFAGKVGTGFNSESLTEIRMKLDDVKVIPKPFKKLPPDVGRGVWVEPKLVCEVEFTEWTDEGRLRHPSFQGLREDKKAKDVHRDQEKTVAEAVREAEAEVAAEPAAQSEPAKAPARANATKNADRVDVAGVSVSHPDRVVYPETGEHKIDLVEYYHAVSAHMLPHVGGRPVSVLRIPGDINGEQFFQRHLPANGGLHNVDEVEVPIKNRTERYMAIDDEQGLLSLSQWGVVEFHPWQCRVDEPLLPDRMIFDLDPDPEAPWQNVIDGASEIRERMRELGLESFLKTTGGKGLHVVVPIQRRFGFPAIKAFTRAIAESMAHDDPKRYIATMSKEKRKGKIFVDYLRNDITATAVSAFSVRARPGATVSTPLLWSELRPGLKPAEFNIHTVPDRLARQKADPWADYFKVDQGISEDFLKALKIDAR
jgi:bifunctional non-homologous end joining protein LigD